MKLLYWHRPLHAQSALHVFRPIVHSQNCKHRCSPAFSSMGQPHFIFDMARFTSSGATMSLKSGPVSSASVALSFRKSSASRFFRADLGLIHLSIFRSESEGVASSNLRVTAGLVATVASPYYDPWPQVDTFRASFGFRNYPLLFPMADVISSFCYEEHPWSDQ